MCLNNEQNEVRIKTSYKPALKVIEGDTSSIFTTCEGQVYF